MKGRALVRELFLPQTLRFRGDLKARERKGSAGEQGEFCLFVPEVRNCSVEKGAWRYQIVSSGEGQNREQDAVLSLARDQRF